MGKRLILLLDGTWNEPDFTSADTNIVRLREIISSSLDQRSSLVSPEIRGPQLRPGQRIAAGRTYGDATENVVFYQRGVGTGPFDRFSGGVFGEGLDQNIRRAYRFLSFHFRPGDEVFIFGFSRGAYTARSLVGLIAAAGLLRREWCTTELENMTWRYYQVPPNERMPGVWSYLSPYVQDRRSFQIDCIGLFDTVGALGIPLTVYRRLNRQKYEFHDVELGSITKVNLQALAIDEHREAFQAAVWRKPKFKSLNSITEQVWFPGAHGDVGGGYFTYGMDSCEELSDISLDWMLRRLHANFPRFPINLGIRKPLSVSSALSIQHEPRKLFYRATPYAIRSIANIPIPAGLWKFEKNVCFDRHAVPAGEMVHISAVERLGNEVPCNNRRSWYQPKNLIHVLDTIRKTYTDGAAGKQLCLVDWNGNQIDPLHNRAKAITTIEAARSRLERAARSAKEVTG